MAKKTPRRSVEALHRALQHHIQVEQDLADLHRALNEERDDVANADVIRAKAEHLMLSARLFDMLLRLDPGHRRTSAWRRAQLDRVMREGD